MGSPEYSRRTASRLRHTILPNHRCINLRGGRRSVSLGVRKNGEAVVFDVSGPLIVDKADPMIRAAIDGLGLTFP